MEMRTIKKQLTLLFCGLLLICITTATAQNAQTYWFHVDYVYPSKIASYEAVAKNLVDLAKENQEERGWAAFAADDYRYFSIAPIAGMEDLGKNPFPKIAEKLGDEKFGELFREFDEYYDKHSDFLLSLSNTLSYMPDGMTIMPEGKNYRRNTLYYFKPKDRAKVIETAKAFKELYTNKGSKMHYRVYLSGFGTPESYLMVAIAAENLEDYAKMAAENSALLGDEGKKLFTQLQSLLMKLEQMSGNMRPDLSYSPEK